MVKQFTRLSTAKAIGFELPAPKIENAVAAESLCAARPITTCSGCPHRGTMISLNQAVKNCGYKKDEVIITGDIGCTILGMNPPYHTLWTELAMGASTVAMITTAGMMAPMMEVMGFTSPLAKVMVVLAIGAGSMVASHANDSYFWVVSQFSDMKTDEAYKCQTGMTAVMGITIIALLFVLSLFV